MKRAGAKASGVVLGSMLVLVVAGYAQAQDVMVAAGYAGLPVKSSAGNEGGIQVGEGARLHAGIGAEMGYDSNIFYQPTSAVSSPLLRILPYVDLTNQTASSELTTGIFYDLNATLQYRHIFSSAHEIDDSGIRDTVSPTVSGVLDFSQAQHFGLSLNESFARTEEAPYIPGQSSIIRDANTASLQLRWSPGGGRIQGILRYSNRLDIFEDPIYTPDRSMTNDVLLDLSWRWFPKTALFVSAQQGNVHYLESGTQKVDSYPLTTAVGIRGLITEKVTIGLAAGYANGFYQDSRNPTGVGLISGRADVAYRPTVLTSLSLGYQHHFQNSLVGNFYNVDMVHAALRQAVADRAILTAFGHYEYRRFDAPADPASMTSAAQRVDHYVSAGLSADYYVKSWAYVGAGYFFFKNASNAQYSDLRAEYVKQQVFGRIGLTY